MSRLIRCTGLFVMVVVLSLTAVAQITAVVDDDDIQSWNDIGITVPLNKKTDLYFPVTFRFTRNLGRFNEGRIGAGVVYKPAKSFSISPVYTFIKVRNAASRFVTENRLSLALVYRLPIKKVGIYHRSQFEKRFRPNIDQWRYRPSIRIEKELPEDFVRGLKVAVVEEPFYDSISGRFSRNRLAIGINKTLNKNTSVDIYYLRQDDNFSFPRVLHVIGTNWKIKL